MNEKMFLDDPIVIEMDSEWVSEGLETEFRHWAHFSPVFISAQTGRGKNHFIMKKLIPHALQTNQQVFLFSNRSALNVQQKRELLGTLGIPDIDSDEELECKKDFGPIIVLNYQSALSYLNEITKNRDVAITRGSPAGFQRNGYAVFDEAHFFLSDATFNADTEKIFKKLLSTFPLYTCIYMTATPDNILEIVKSSEKENAMRLHGEYCDILDDFFKRGFFARGEQCRYKSCALNIYKFPRNYSNYKVSFFYNIESLYDRLSRASSNDKWLCFINNKKRQSEIAERLNKGKKVAVCFDSSKKDDEKIWSKLVEGELPSNVFLTTSALDNGVNITDPGLRNIMIEGTDKVSFLQCLGRKRRQAVEQVHLYVQVPTLDLIESRLDSIKDSLRFIDKYRGNPRKFLEREWSNFHQKYRKLFRIEYNQSTENNPFAGSYQLVLNGFAHTELLNQWNFYTDLQNRIGSSSKLDISYAYPKMVMEWLDLDGPIDWFDISDVKAKAARAELKKLLDSHIKSGIPDDEHEEFCNRFKELVGAILFGENVIVYTKSGPSRMSSYLKRLKGELGILYTIDGRGTWKVSKQ